NDLAASTSATPSVIRLIRCSTEATVALCREHEHRRTGPPKIPDDRQRSRADPGGGGERPARARGAGQATGPEPRGGGHRRGPPGWIEEHRHVPAPLRSARAGPRPGGAL